MRKNSRSNLRKRIAQLSWSPENLPPYGKERRLEKSRSIESESIPFSHLVQEEEDEEGGYSLQDYGHEDEEEYEFSSLLHDEHGISDLQQSVHGSPSLQRSVHEEEEIGSPFSKSDIRTFTPRATIPSRATEYHLYTTDEGDTFRLRSSSTKSKNGFTTPQNIGLDRNQLTLNFRDDMLPPGPAPPTVDPTPHLRVPLAEDGYLSQADRDNPTINPYSVEYVKEVLRRNDVIRAHEDYEFLSLFASHLNLTTEDVFLEESVTRKQAATSALLEAVSARPQARALQLQTLDRRMERLRVSITQNKQELSNKIGTIRAIDERDILTTSDLLEDKINEYEAMITFRNFLYFLKHWIENNGTVNVTNVLNEDAPKNLIPSSAPGGTGYPLYVSYVIGYLRVASPNSQRSLTKDVLRYYERYKSDTVVGNAAKNALVFFGIVDFYVSFLGSFPKQFDLEGVAREIRLTSPGSIIAPGFLGKNWRSINLRIVLTKDENDPDLLGNQGTVPKPEKSEKADQNLLDQLFVRTFEERIPRFIRKDLLKDDLSSLTTPDLASYSNFILNYCNRMVAILNGYIDRNPTNPDTWLDVLITINDSAINQDVAESANLSRFILNILLRDNVRTTLDTLGVRTDLANINSRYNSGQDISKDILEVSRRWSDSVDSIRRELEREIRLDEQAIEEIQNQIDVMVRTGRGGGGEVDVPYRTTLEWALKPINTGRMDIAPWALAAINAGHSAFKRLVARGGSTTSRWDKIDRNVIQRDELMGPLFAEFCATFVNKARIANPRRYMRASAEKERMLRKASIWKSMVTDLRYLAPQRKFVPRRRR